MLFTILCLVVDFEPNFAMLTKPSDFQTKAEGIMTKFEKLKTNNLNVTSSDLQEFKGKIVGSELDFYIKQQLLSRLTLLTQNTQCNNTNVSIVTVGKNIVAHIKPNKEIMNLFYLLACIGIASYYFKEDLGLNNFCKPAQEQQGYLESFMSFFKNPKPAQEQSYFMSFLLSPIIVGKGILCAGGKIAASIIATCIVVPLYGISVLANGIKNITKGGFALKIKVPLSEFCLLTKGTSRTKAITS